MIKDGLTKKIIETEFCIIGGGISGLCAAIQAARLGVKTVLIHERSTLGGNASSEVRMWICGTQEHEKKETGLLEEIALENYFYNPTKNYYLWDAILYGKAINEPNLTVFMNCTCFDAKMDNLSIKSILAYQMTTQTMVTVKAKYFADCSGDSILAPLTKANFMYGREDVNTYKEEIISTHETADMKTMGNSCLIQARKTEHKVPFKAPIWAEKVSVEKLKEKHVNLADTYENFWYIEIGGLLNVIDDAESINKRLIALCLGVWDTIKNSGEFDAENYELDFLGFLGAKRESRRYIGDYILSAKDIINGQTFEDEVAYGGWPLDDHYPEGFDGKKSNITIPVKSYSIPYRSLYSNNIQNLFFAGRNISVSHAALSSARVMGTCSTLGQAVGVAAFVANKYAESPKEAGINHINEIQQTLLINDCYLLNTLRKVHPFNQKATTNYPLLINGIDRDLSNSKNGEIVDNNKTISLKLETESYVERLKIVFDSDLLRETYDMDDSEKYHMMRCNTLDNSPIMHMPYSLARDFEVFVYDFSNNMQRISFKDNLKRNILLDIKQKITQIDLVIKTNWGGKNKTKIFCLEIV